MPRLAQTAEAHRNHQIQDSVALGEKSLWLTVPHHTQLPNLCKLRAQKNKQENYGEALMCFEGNI